MTETFDLDALIARADDFDAVLDRRNRLEVGLGAGLALFFAGFALHAAVWMQMATAAVGLGLLSLACVWVAWTVRRRGRAPTGDPSAPTTDFRAAHRAELVHQIALLRSVPRWYLAPFLPGLAVFIVGPTAVDAWQGVAEASAEWGTSLGVLAAILAVYGVVWAVNVRAARKLERELEALDAQGG